MKRFLTISITIMLLFSIVSCRSVTNDLPVSDPESENSSDSISAPIKGDTSSTPSVEEPSHIEYYSPTMEDYEAYLSGIELLELPKNFVYYDSIQQFGEFHSFVYLSNVQTNDYSEYMYSFIDESGYELILYVEEHSDETISTENTVMSISSNDMRFLDVKSQKNSCYYQGELKYNYVYGKLLTVEWIQNGLEFTLYAEPLHQYPPNETTLTGKLLNKSLASNAYETYIAPITQTQK